MALLKTTKPQALESGSEETVNIEDFFNKVEETKKKIEEEQKLEEEKKLEQELETDPWKKEVYEIKKLLSLEDLIFTGHTKAEVQVVPDMLWVTYKSVSHDLQNSILVQALKDSSGEPAIVYENHYALLMLVESIESIRTKSGQMPLPRDRSEKYIQLQSLNSNLVRRLINYHNMFDAAVALLLNDGVVDELKK